MKKNEILMVLVPHRDARIELQKYSESFFKNGLYGVYPFPCVIPAASLSRPLKPSELKHAAYSLRKFMGNGKFNFFETSAVSLKINKNDMTLFGPKTGVLLPARVFGAEIDNIIFRYSPLICGTFLIPQKYNENINSLLTAFSVPPVNELNINFRSAALANMYWRRIIQNGEICYRWKIEKLYWLPRKK